ncbi:MAG TPA: nucleoside monophosphate kinase [Candidatus Saccharimonadales bacterium]|nr:nucleoside monophosphate kinase [Candidatus Saccharimonadales bacterium]
MYDDEKLDVIKDWLGAGSINIFGRPFAGKDTQGERLATILNAQLIGSGEILRGNTIPDHIKEYMRAGELIPSEDFVNIVLPYLNQPLLADKPLILSSIGRWHGEEDGVIKVLEKSNHKLMAVVYLDISDTDSYDRWTALTSLKDRQGRNDDAEEVLKTRLTEFQEKTLPVIDYYRNLGMLIEINGKRMRDQVIQDILDALSKRTDIDRV